MSTRDRPTLDAAELRKQAEELARSKESKQHLDLEAMTPEEARQTLHELRVHKIELEIQNSELRKAQMELAVEQQRYFDLYDLAPVGYCTISEQGLILKANLMAASLLGVARGALVSRRFSQFVLKDDQDNYYLHRKQLFKTSEPQSFELRLLKADGMPFWARLEAVAAQGEDGESTCRVVISDISAQVALRGAHDFLCSCVWKPGGYDFFHELAQYLAQVLGMDFVCIDRLEGDGLTAQTVAVYFDGHFEDNISYSLKDTPCGEVVGQNVCCYTDRVRHLFPKDIVLQEMKAESYVGTTLWGSDGKAIGLIAVIGRKPLANQQLAESLLRLVGIRAAGELERTQAEEKLRETAERLRLANKATNDVIWDWDVIQDIQRWNEVGTAVFGWTEIVEHPVSAHWWVKRIHPDDRERVHNSFFAVVNNPELDTWHDEYRFRKADGADAVVLDRGYVLRDDQGKAIRMIGAMQDISERKRAETELLLAKEAAEAANLAKSEFLANMSHEIRTPLNGIMGMIQLLETTTLDEEQLQFCSLAIQSTNRLNALLSDILDLARIDVRKLLIRAERFNMPNTIAQTIDLFESVAVQTGVALTRHIDPDIPHWVVGDSLRLQQVLNNLIGNAFKFTKSGHVHVEAYALPSRSNDTLRVFFAIEDTGCGIADEELGNLFKPFTQISQGYTRNHQGAGLGLTISKQLVGLIGGNMAVESEEGVGTTFAFCVTFSNEVRPHEDEAALESRTAPPVSLRILLAEDDETTIFSIRRLLEKSGHSVTVAHNGQEAMEMHAANDFDLILMDVAMPIMNGIEACQRIRGSRNSRKRDIPIIALTAYAMPGDKEKFLAAGMSGYVAKPINLESLMQIMAETLAEQRR